MLRWTACLAEPLVPASLAPHARRQVEARQGTPSRPGSAGAGAQAEMLIGQGQPAPGPRTALSLPAGQGLGGAPSAATAAREAAIGLVHQLPLPHQCVFELTLTPSQPQPQPQP